MGKTYEEAKKELVNSLAAAWALHDMFHDAVAWCLTDDYSPQTSTANPSADFQEKIAACKPALDEAALRLEALRLAVAVISSGHTAKDDNVMDAADDYLAFLRGEK